MNKQLRPLKRPMMYAMAVSLFLSLAAFQTRAEDQHVALEVVAVKLKAASDMDAFRKNDMLVAEWVSKQPGFISRETATGPDGEWFTIVHWASLKDAENAGAAFMKSEQAKTAMSMIDQNSMLYKHYTKNE
jgi:hypothetical protein